MKEIRWTDKVSLDSDGNIRDFNGRKIVTGELTMKRLWITEAQADTLKRALNNQVIRLKAHARNEEDLDIKAKYLDEAVKISDIIDIIEM